MSSEVKAKPCQNARREAKKLKRAYDDPRSPEHALAAGRCRAQLRDLPVGVLPTQKAQHVIARERGLANWADMLTEAKERI